MIVSGGSSTVGRPPRDGAAYDPATNSWRAIADHPDRGGSPASAMWTGSEMLVWADQLGGGFPQTERGGAAYDPIADAWAPLGRPDAPPDGTYDAIWTDRSMLIWGSSESLGSTDGALYDPIEDTWRDIPKAPIKPRFGYSLTWSGNEALVFGGVDIATQLPLANGAAYDPATDDWRPLPEAPLGGRYDHTAVWTDGLLIVYGGSSFPDDVLLGDGASYDPESDDWTRLPSPLDARAGESATWTGTELIVWGGAGCAQAGDEVSCGIPLANGAAYELETKTWHPLAPGPLGPRSAHLAVWTGTGLIVWGGQTTTSDGLSGLADGAIYDPERDRWLTLP